LRRLRKLDFAAIAILVVIWLLLVALINRINFEAFFLTIFAITVFISFTALLIRRIGAVVLFTLTGSLAAALTGEFATLGVNTIPVLLVVGVTFELVLIIIRTEVKNVPLNLIFGTGIAAASMPWTMLLLANQTVKGLMPFVWNFSLTAFFIGVAGAVISFLVWYNVKNAKAVIKFEYAV